MSRSVPLWVASSDDAAIPKAVKLRIWAREGGRCSITGRKIMPGDAFDFEHRVSLSMGGRHAEDNIVLALRIPHRAKSAKEATARAKADRVALKHRGMWPESRAKIRSRGFEKTRSVLRASPEG